MGISNSARFRTSGRQPSNGNSTMPHQACSRKAEIAELLLKAGASVNEVNAKGQSALHEASMADNDTIRVLLKYGAEPNFKDDHGKTPLHYACEYGCTKNVEVLLDNGSDPKVTDKYGFSGLDIAAQYSYESMQVLLKSHIWTNEEIIHAYETVALHPSCPSPYDCMLKATTMRIKCYLPKTPLAPLECYNYTNEWETKEELRCIKDNPLQIQLQCVLARERIFRGRYLDLKLIFNFLYYTFKGSDADEVNSLLRHMLDLHKTNEDYLQFSCTFYECSKFLVDAVLIQDLEFLHLETITYMLDTAIRCANKLQKISDCKKTGFYGHLIQDLEKTLIVTGAFISLLFKRSKLRNRITEKDVAIVYVKTLWKDFSSVSCAKTSYNSSVPVILMNTKYHLFEQNGMLPSLEVMQCFITHGFDINYSDDDGDTLLHLIVTLKKEIPIENCDTLACLFLYYGGDPRIKNKAGKSVYDIVHGCKEEYSERMPKFMARIDSFSGCQTLTDLVARYLHYSDLLFDKYLPTELSRLVAFTL